MTVPHSTVNPVSELFHHLAQFSHLHHKYTMNTLLKSVLRFPAMRFINATSVSAKNTLVTKEFARTLFSTSGRSPEDKSVLSKVTGNLHTPSMNCMCGCNAKFVHTKGNYRVIRDCPEYNLTFLSFQANGSWSSSWPKRLQLNARRHRARRSLPMSRDSR